MKRRRFMVARILAKTVVELVEVDAPLRKPTVLDLMAERAKRERNG